jgi:hypothetical protein
MRLHRTVTGKIQDVNLEAIYLTGSHSWIDYHHVGPEKEKALIHRQMECLKTMTGEYPVGWYYGRISPYSKALVHEVHEELKAPLLWEADTYADDLPYWVDVPAEKDSASPKGMLMIPYR